MKYSFDFKLRQVEKYTDGKPLDTPSGLTRNAFSRQVYRWVCLYRIGGEDALKHSTKGHHLSAEEKMAIVKRALDGEPIVKLAALSGVSEDAVRRWIPKYRTEGPSSLESRRRNTPVAKRKKKRIEEHESEELKRLRKENRRLEMENALLKKVRALVSEQERREAGAPGREPAESSSRSGKTGGSES